MLERFAPSVDQLRELRSKLDAMLEDSASISRLLSAAYGQEDQRAVRAGEMNGSIQRLLVELDRAAKAKTA